MNPTTDNDADINLRQTWWHVIAKPPADSPYYAAAQQSRAATWQECTTIAHHNAWHSAMIKEITTIIQAGHHSPSALYPQLSEQSTSPKGGDGDGGGGDSRHARSPQSAQSNL